MIYFTLLTLGPLVFSFFWISALCLTPISTLQSFLLSQLSAIHFMWILIGFLS